MNPRYEPILLDLEKLFCYQIRWKNLSCVDESSIFQDPKMFEKIVKIPVRTLLKAFKSAVKGQINHRFMMARARYRADMENQGFDMKMFGKSGKKT